MNYFTKNERMPSTQLLSFVFEAERDVFEVAGSLRKNSEGYGSERVRFQGLRQCRGTFEGGDEAFRPRGWTKKVAVMSRDSEILHVRW